MGTLRGSGVWRPGSFEPCGSVITLTCYDRKRRTRSFRVTTVCSPKKKNVDFVRNRKEDIENNDRKKPPCRLGIENKKNIHKSIIVTRYFCGEVDDYDARGRSYGTRCAEKDDR